MNPRERIVTILFIEQIKHTKSTDCQGVKYQEIVLKKEDDSMARKTRSDCRVGNFEKKHGLPPGTFRNRNGRDTRSDKKIGTIRKEYKKITKT